MATQIKMRRGTTSQHSSFTGSEAEVTIDTDKEVAVVHNGSTAGGFPLARADQTLALSGGTISGTLGVAGVLTTTAATVHNGGITMPDNAKAIFGAGSDLQIYHDGSSSHIVDNGTGNLRMQGVVQVTDNPSSNDGRILFGDSAAASGTVHYDFSAGDFLFENTWANAAADFVFRTNSVDALTISPTGIDVTGTADIGAIGTSVAATLRLKTDGDNDALALNIEENDGTEGWGVGVNAAGDLKFYNSGTGTATGLSAVTFSDDNNVGIGTAAPLTLLHITEDSGSSSADITLERQDTSVSANNSIGSLLWYAGEDGGEAKVGRIGIVAEGNFTDSNSETYMLFENTANGAVESRETMRIRTTGDLVLANTGGTFQTDTAGTSNFRAGKNAGNSISTGDYNVLLGDEAGTAVTEGIRNTLIGSEAGDALISGNDNTAVGALALSADTLGKYSTAIGRGALKAQNFDSDTAAYNTAVGYSAGESVSTGIQNVLIGGLAGDSLNDADFNVGVGLSALGADTKGSKNVALGHQTLAAQNFTAATDSYNTAVGFEAGNDITTGIQNTLIGGLAGDALTGNGFSGSTRTAGADYNTAVGMLALSNDTKGNRSVAVGYGALEIQNFTTTTDTYNVAVGFNAGQQTTSGTNNTLIGGQAGDAITDGSDNVAIGKGALSTENRGAKNTAVGYFALVSQDAATGATYNTAVGASAGASVSTGTTGTFIGSLAGNYVTTAPSTTFVGYAAGRGISGQALTGSFNTAIGNESGYNLSTTGQKNTFLGTYAGYYNGSSSTSNGITTGVNNTGIGFAAYPTSATVSNEFTLGNGDVANLRCADTSISALSDERDKTNIVDVPLGLDFINTLRPVAFDWDRRDGSNVGKKDFGFIAQELKTAQDATSYADHMRLVHEGTVLVPDAENANEGTLDADDNPVLDVSGTMQECLEADPMKTYPVLVKAVQELSTALDAALARIAVLEG